MAFDPMRSKPPEREPLADTGDFAFGKCNHFAMRNASEASRREMDHFTRTLSAVLWE